jgi:putative ABC transport system permease protein
MILLRLAWASLRNRLLTTSLTVFSIALSLALLLSVERMRRGAEEGFTQTISQTDLIVGARSGPLNLLLYTVFNMGSATNNISYESYEAWKKNPAVEWTIPYSLGDGHRGFRVVGTNDDFYEHYRYRGGESVQFEKGVRPQGLWDVALGAEVAETLGYQIGQKIVVAHGGTSGEGLLKHDDKPFVVTGILKRTGTALDRSLYITLEGLEAIHLDWRDGVAPSRDQSIPAERIQKEKIKIDAITAFFLRTKSRIETLRLQREINTYAEEPLMAIIPGVALAELWRGMGYLEQTLAAISWLVLGVGLVAMLIALLTLLEQRRREMSILRAVGAGPRHILLLLLLEASLLTLLGIVLGTAVELAAFSLLKKWLAGHFGLDIAGAALTGRDLVFLTTAWILGTVVGVLPALRAFFFTLKDGLSVKS